MTIRERMQAPTPPFFRKLRNIGLVLVAVSATIVAAPIALPAVLIKVAGYLAIAGTVASTVSQAATQTTDADSAGRIKTPPDHGR